MDIYLLASDIANSDTLKKLKAHDEDCRDRIKGAKLRKGAQGLNLTFEEIKDSVSGYARIVYYKSTNGTTNAANCELEQVIEGEFHKGKIEGYARGISAINGSCSAGFHHAGIPNGKFCYYKSDGTFAQAEGIYEGHRCIQMMQLKTFEQAILTKDNAILA